MNATLQNPARPWPLALGLLGLSFALIVAFYWDTVAAMVGIWERSGTFTHAFLVPPISLWLVWRLKDDLAKFTPQANIWFALPMLAMGAVWLLGEVAAVNVLTQFAVVSMIILMVPLLLGWSFARAITFPLLFLYFCVPFGEFVMPTLMQWTANVTVAGVRMTGVPVYQEGLQFVIPSGHWSVVEACSGVRYLIASLCVGVLFAYLNYTSIKRRLIFVLAALLVPIFANWVRAYGIVMLGHLSGNKLATGVDHLVYGWVFFGLVITMLFVVGMRWQEPEQAPHAPLSATDGGRAAWSMPAACGLLVTMLALPPAALWLINKGNVQAVPQMNASMLPAIEGWSTAPAMTSWQPLFVRPSAEMQTTFKQGDKWVGVYIAYYRQQDASRKLVSSENMLVRSENSLWAQVSNSTHQQGDARLREAVLRSGDLSAVQEQRLKVWQWYRIAGHETASDMKGKLLTTWSKLSGQGDDGAVVMLYAPAEQAEQTLPAFYMAAHPALVKLLEQVAEQR